MSKRGENIYLRKDKRWEGRYKKGYASDGRTLYGYVYGKTYTEVKAKLVAQKATVSDPTLPQNATLGTVSRQWLHRQQIIAKESTYANYDTIVCKQIVPALGHLPLSRINAAVLDQFTKTKLCDGRLHSVGGLSAKYVRDILAVLRSILAFGSQLYGHSVPYRLSGLPRVESMPISIVPDNERRRMETLCFNASDYRYQGILLCLYTGLRIGELCALCWDDFAPECEHIYVQRTLQRIRNMTDEGRHTKVAIGVCKTRSSIRKIPLPDFLIKHLRVFKQNICSNAYFLTGSAERFMEPRGYQDFFARFLKRHQFEIINFHVLRHTFASRCIRIGFDPKTLSEILGHSSVELTLNRYVHTDSAQKKIYMERLSM